MISMFLFSCMTKTVVVGTVDIVEPTSCHVQLLDESIVWIESKMCASLQEGDIIKVVRIK